MKLMNPDAKIPMGYPPHIVLSTDEGMDNFSELKQAAVLAIVGRLLLAY